MQRSLFDDLPHDRLSDRDISDVRARHPGMVLLFRNGNRYEMFDEDATLASEILGLQTASATRLFTSFAGEALEGHLRTLLHVGHRVAICESESNGQ